MSEETTVPEENTNREPEDEQNSSLRDLEVVKTVLEVIVLVARLIRQL